MSEEKAKRVRTKVEPVKYPAEPKLSAEIDADFIIAYCQDKNQIKWLKACASKTSVGKDGKERRFGIFQIRSEFVDKFYPQLKTAKAASKDSLYSRIMNL